MIQWQRSENREKEDANLEKYFQINRDGQNIRCKLYHGKGAPIEKIVLSLHGFAGHKDNAAAQKFADRVLTKYKGTGILTYDLPCHGDDVKKKLVLQDCMTYLGMVLDYIRADLGIEEIYAYATSFGGYLVLKYIREQGNPFRKIALRCPAVNMAEVLTGIILENGDLDQLHRGKNVKVGFDRKVEINRQFLADLEESDIRKLDYLDYAEDILILHGTKDEVVPFEAGEAFAENNLIEFLPVENADHRFQNPACMEFATKKVLEFFDF